MIRKIVAILLLAACGAALLPLETDLAARQKAAHFRTTALNLSLRDSIGQMGFLAALSGFRSPLSAVLWIQAHIAWENLEWGRMVHLFDTVTTLQPHSMLYWDTSAWHMAWNASVAALQDKNQPSEAMRIRNERQYIKLGKDYLERGIASNPDTYFLYAALGRLLQYKMEDHCEAAKYFQKAAEFPDAPPYILRNAVYEMAKCPNREKEAYTLAKKLYDEGPSERLPSLITTIKELEKKLDVPPAQRIDSTQK